MSQLVGIAPPVQSGLVVAAHVQQAKKRELERWITLTVILLAVMKWMVTPDQMFHENAVIRNVATYRMQIMYGLGAILIVLAARYYHISMLTDLTNWVPVLPKEGFTCGGSVY